MLTRLKSLFQSTTVTATTVMEVDDPRLILQAYEPAFWITPLPVAHRVTLFSTMRPRCF